MRYGAFWGPRRFWRLTCRWTKPAIHGPFVQSATGHLDYYVGSANYRNNLVRIGWSEADLEKPGSDDLFDAIVAWGDLDRIGAKVRERFDAGADQVVLNIVAADAATAPLAELRRLAPLATG